MDKKLEYFNQLAFKRWALKHGACFDFYFDNVYGVDGNTNRNIPHLVANGTLTWNEALGILKNHFKANA